MKQKGKIILKLLKTRDSYLITGPVFLFLFICGFLAPSALDFLTFKADAATRITGNLLTGFIAVPGTILAVAAILFAILQVSNRKIEITQLVFQNIYVIPLVYWVLFNVIVLIVTQLFLDTMNNYVSLRILVILSYNLIFLFFGLVFTFYRLFRYLNYTTIIDDYLLEVKALYNRELDPGFTTQMEQQLKQKSKEVYAELSDCIDKDDELLGTKYLDSFADSLDRNPVSKYTRDFAHNLAKWISTSYLIRSGLSNLVLEFWRKRLIIKVTGEQKFNYFNIERVPINSYKFASANAELQSVLIQEFSLRLKEIAQRFYYWSQQNEILVADTNFGNLISLHVEFSELVKFLISKSDYDNLEIVLNDIRMMQETFRNGEYSGVVGRVIANRASGIAESSEINETAYLHFTVLREALRDMDMILIGNLYWIYFQISRGNIKVADVPRLNEMTVLLEHYLRFDQSLETIVYLYNQEDNRLGWEEWISQVEMRLSGKAYVIPTIVDIISAGFALTMIKQPTLNIGRQAVTDIEQLKFLLARTRDYLNGIRQASEQWVLLIQLTAEQLEERIVQVFAAIDALDNRIENNFTTRLAAARISPEKVEAFKTIMHEQWDSTRDLSKVFETFNAVAVNPEETLVDAGPNVNFTRGKVMFVEGELYSFIYGIEWGKTINRSVEARFVEKIKPLAEPNEDQSLAEIFDRGISALVAAELSPNVIFIDIGLFMTNERALSASGRFHPNSTKEQQYDFEIGGYFDGILPVIVIKDFGFQDLVLITQLPTGVIMQQRQSPEYYANNLIIEINDIDHAKADELIAERQKEGVREPLTTAELMASMQIHVHQIFDFKIADQKAIKVFKSTLANYGRT